MNSTPLPIRRSRSTRRAALVAAGIAAIMTPLLTTGETSASTTRPSASPVKATPASRPASTAPARARLATTVNVELCAHAGTMAVPAKTVSGTTTIDILGYTNEAACTTNATQPGLAAPIRATVGDTINITLHNGLVGENTSLAVVGQPAANPIAPDLVGVAPGASKTYTIVAAHPGTFLLEAGLLSTGNAQHQVAMGLYGALVIDAAPNQAYDAPATAYTSDKVLLMGEIDPALKSSNKMTFDMRNFKPKYFMLNGAVYGGSPSTANIGPVNAGDKVLLRFANAGVSYHSMSLLGAAQTILAYDGRPLTYPHTLVAETFGPGQATDSLVTIPATAAGTKLPVYDGNLMLNNSNTAGYGGMLTFIEVSGTAPVDTTGPAMGTLTATPNPTSTTAITLTAQATDASGVSAVEYFVDSIGASGSGIALSSTDFPGTSVTASGAVDVTSLATGGHTIQVHAKDVNGNWGAFKYILITVDKVGPVTSGLSLSPNPSNGSLNVSLHGTGSDSAAGGSTIAAAEYFIDVASPVDGGGTPMTVNLPATVASLDATIPAATVNALAHGQYDVKVHAKDSLGTWGPLQTIALKVDKVAPAGSSATATPDHTNGTVGFNSSTPAVRVEATFTDQTAPTSNIVAAEGTIDAGTTAFPFAPKDGGWNSASEVVTADVPLTTVKLWSEGAHTVHIRARDAAGNWSSVTDATIYVDKTGPSVSGAAVAPTASNNSPVVVTANASDSGTGGSNIGGGEIFIDPSGTPVNGTGIAMLPTSTGVTASISGTIPGATVGGLTPGNHTLRVYSRDAAGNWSPGYATTTLLIDRTAPTFTSITLTPTSIVCGTAAVTLTVNGASDGAGGSGVVGGEYWFGGTNITPGAGTQFSGTGTSIATASLNPGTTTVRVRIKDLAGNWSTGFSGVRTANLTVTAGTCIFSDGFESGNTNAWGATARSTNTLSRLNVTASSAMDGSFGLQAQGNNTNYLQYSFGTTANPVASVFDARFYFNPNGNTSSGKDVFAAATSSTFGTQVFHVRYRLNGSTPQVQLQVGATPNATWVNLTSGSHRIEVVWQAVGSGGPNPGTLVLYVDGVSSQTLTTTSTNSIGAFRLGSVTSIGNSTLMYFDKFAAKRTASPLLGP